MVSAFAVTSAVSAAPSGKSGVQQFDIRRQPDTPVIGKLVVDTTTGYWVASVNLNEDKDMKQLNKEYPSQDIPLGMWNPDGTPASILIGFLLSNKGGTAHGEGTLDQTTCDWLVQFGTDAIFFAN